MTGAPGGGPARGRGGGPGRGSGGAPGGGPGGGLGGGLAPEQESEIRGALRAEREETLARMTALRREFDGIVASSALVATDDEHDPEGATIAFERAQLAALLAAAQDHLADLDEALGRLREGRYGWCESCGRPIAPARLAARPTARTCISCAPGRR